MKFTVDEMLGKLPLPANDKWKNGVWDIEAYKKGAVSLVFFAPRGVDYQTQHDEDEYYFIARGSAKIIIDEEIFDCDVGDSFFVPARTQHHFDNFTEDFCVWAIFF